MIFFVFLDEYIAKYLDYATPQIMVGDININVERSTKTVKDYINLIKEHDLKQIVKEYTRFDIKNNSSSIIDHVMVNNDKTKASGLPKKYTCESALYCRVYNKISKI